MGELGTTPNAHQFYCIVDADNLPSTRDLLIARACEEVANSTSSCVAVASRNSSLLSRIAEQLGRIMPHAEVIQFKASAMADAADILLAVYLGRLAERSRASEGMLTAVILSMDKKIHLAALEAARIGMIVVLPQESTLAAPKTYGSRVHKLAFPLLPPAAPKVTRDIPAPQSFLAVDIGLAPARLECLHVPYTEAYPAPEELPFPAGKAVVTVGSRGDLFLASWEKPGRGNQLYSPHVEFRYLPGQSRSWTIRALRGQRRGNRDVLVEGESISSRHGLVRIRDGMEIRLGGFRFRFRENYVAQRSALEDPARLVSEIEAALRQLVDGLTMSELPPDVVMELTVEGAFNWDSAYIRHYVAVLLHAWEADVMSECRRCVRSKTQLSAILGRFNRLRNIAMHPSKGAMSLEDRTKLAELHLMFCSRNEQR